MTLTERTRKMKIKDNRMSRSILRKSLNVDMDVDLPLLRSQVNHLIGQTDFRNSLEHGLVNFLESLIDSVQHPKDTQGLTDRI